MTIETLNHWGAQLLPFAWPVFWQSSLLILVLLALDLLLRRRLRAAVRYGLWLVLLLKLLLPPSLALPTSVAWWLRSSGSQPSVSTVREAPLVETSAWTAAPVKLSPIVAPNPAKLSPAAWTLIGSSVVSLMLFVSMVFRGRKQSAPACRGIDSARKLKGILEGAKAELGIRSNIRLQLTERAMSPAACGLFRPLILLPRLLVEQLPPLQLRAVLLHELFHLRRGDVWVNCLQTFLQVFYWWHPLLWFANARIRRLREEAVDDAVVVALKQDAEHYAAALVGVARLALRRPATHLALVGIVEPKKVLRRRVERLLNGRIPKRAGLSVLSLAGIAAFTAAALPMAEAPLRINPTLIGAQWLDPRLDGAGEGELPLPEDHDWHKRPSSLVAVASLKRVEPMEGTVKPSASDLPEPAAPAEISEHPPAGPEGKLVVHATFEELDGLENEVERGDIRGSAEVTLVQPSTNAVQTQSTPPSSELPGFPLPQLLPQMMQDDLLRLRDGIHSILPSAIVEIESGDADRTNRTGLWPVRHALWRTRSVSTNLAFRMAGHVNMALEPLARVHNKAVDIGIVPSFLALPRPQRVEASTNAIVNPPPRKLPLLGDLPVIGRLFRLPPEPNRKPAAVPKPTN